ncbi:DNA-binding protein [Streptomyces sp. NBC_01803]|uniref:DNA-binding protein n=1 Tax=Streptomyces sp. NBC_01803 TaxID=2975946 RepID=UPI002DDB9D7E|nr:DNA-binding protein [Streptomyces sp. NBC_01803]WSA45011.1 helix-turn-helix domain-containing protein [Streptomyces sp. NBC_01803]
MTRLDSATDVAARDRITSTAQQPSDTVLTIGDLCRQPPLMPLWPDFGRGVLRLAESTTYKLLAEGRLPVEPVQVARKHYVRTAHVFAFLGLAEITENDDSAGVEPAPSVERNTTPTGK